MELENLSFFEIEVLNHLISGGKVFYNHKYSRKDNRHGTFMTIIDGKLSISIGLFTVLLTTPHLINNRMILAFIHLAKMVLSEHSMKCQTTFFQSKDKLISLGVKSESLSSRNSLTDYERI